MAQSNKSNGIFQDIAIIFFSVLIAILLARTDALIDILVATQELEYIGTFIAGMFFTSIFTTAPAIVTLGEIAQTQPIIVTAILGGLGAVVGDLVIFRFIRDRVSEHLVQIVNENGGKKRLKALFKLKWFSWFTFMLGGLVIASPLPDELGISLLGFSKMKLWVFVAISFVGNSVGIYLIGLAARLIV